MLLCRFLLLAAGCLWLTAPSVRAQTPDAAYAVMALDVAPAQAAQGIAVLKAYRDAARKEAGNLGIDVLQEGGWASRFMVYETWRDHVAFDAAEKAAPLTELRDKLKPIAPAPYDRRDYKTVSVGPAKAAPGAIYMLAHCDVPPLFLDKTLVALKEVAEAARKGAGKFALRRGARHGREKPHHPLWNLAKPPGVRRLRDRSLRAALPGHARALPRLAAG